MGDELAVTGLLPPPFTVRIFVLFGDKNKRPVKKTEQLLLVSVEHHNRRKKDNLETNLVQILEIQNVQISRLRTPSPTCKSPKPGKFFSDDIVDRRCTFESRLKVTINRSLGRFQRRI